jgi:hypothetical protein
VSSFWDAGTPLVTDANSAASGFDNYSSITELLVIFRSKVRGAPGSAGFRLLNRQLRGKRNRVARYAAPRRIVHAQAGLSFHFFFPELKWRCYCGN